MKTLRFTILLILSFLICYDEGHAQHVYIPDAAFRSYISTLDPSAIVGTDSLDINNSTVQTLTFLDVSNQGISDITGVEYFISADTLLALNNSLTFFPNLPPTIQYL